MDLLSALEDAHRPAGFQKSYVVELLYASPPEVDSDALATSLQPLAPDLDLERQSGPHSPGGATWRIAAAPIDAPSDDSQRTEVTEVDPLALASWTLRQSRQRVEADRWSEALQQSWWWPEAHGVVPRCSSTLRLRDDRATRFEPRERIEHLQRIVTATLEAVPGCLALHWAPTQQLLQPGQAVEAWRHTDFQAPLPGAINVRFFRVSTGRDENPPRPGGAPEPDEEFLMDTLGLCAVGLHDLQCHFRGLDPEEVSQILYQAALYLWQHGDVIRDGHTVEGPRPDDEWVCRHEVSVAQPERDVIDLDPGFPFSGGVTEGLTEQQPS